MLKFLEFRMKMWQEFWSIYQFRRAILFFHKIGISVYCSFQNLLWIHIHLLILCKIFCFNQYMAKYFTDCISISWTRPRPDFEKNWNCSHIDGNSEEIRKNILTIPILSCPYVLFKYSCFTAVNCYSYHYNLQFQLSWTISTLKNNSLQ
jgi:hypothetical protein